MIPPLSLDIRVKNSNESSGCALKCLVIITNGGSCSEFVILLSLYRVWSKYTKTVMVICMWLKIMMFLSLDNNSQQVKKETQIVITANCK